ncbi:MAG: N-acetyltransferase [Bdellovibrionales bacterium]|nr:N-acetyltransferase [Bdellovibrionales bacterium]
MGLLREVKRDESAVEHHADAQKFSYVTDGRECKLNYEKRDGALDLKHTYVPETDRGNGIGELLVEEALRYASKENLKIIPSCSFVEKYLEKHEQWQHIIKGDSEEKRSLKLRLLAKAKQYWPVFLLVLYGAWLGLVFADPVTTGLRSFMHYVMGTFLVGFSYFKLVDLKGFQQNFSEYDLLASRLPEYGLAYPFIELLLGTAYLGFAVPTVTYIATFLVMSVSLAGVVSTMASGKDLSCACMGTVFDLPVGTVTLIEDASMALMALLMLIMA